MTDYTTHIVKILYEAGSDGLRLKLISRHVYNAVNSFFEPVDRDEVHRQVALFVPAHAKGKHPLFERCSHGVYRLCRKSQEVKRILAGMDIAWGAPAAEVKAAQSQDASQLSLFADEDFL